MTHDSFLFTFHFSLFTFHFSLFLDTHFRLPKRPSASHVVARFVQQPCRSFPVARGLRATALSSQPTYQAAAQSHLCRTQSTPQRPPGLSKIPEAPTPSLRAPPCQTSHR